MKSLLGKIIAWLGTTILIFIIIVGLITTFSVFNIVKSDEETIITQDTAYNIENMEQYFTRYITMVQQLARDKNIVNMMNSNVDKKNYKSSKYYQNVFETLVETDSSDAENILTVYPAKYSNNFSFDNEGWTSGSDFDLNKKEYWFNSQSDIDKNYIICNPYYDSSTDNMVTTVSAPIYNGAKSKIIGVIAIDINVNTICDLAINSVSQYETGYRILVSKDGSILAHKDTENMLKNVSELDLGSSIMEEIENLSGEVVEFKDNDIKSYGSVGVEPLSGWKVVNIVPSKEFNINTTKAIRKIAIINFFSLMIILVMIMFIAKSISKPLRKLAKITDELSQGNLDVDIDLESKDEVGKLAESMKMLTNRLKAYISYINELSFLLTQIGEGNLILDFKHEYNGEFKILKDSLESAVHTLSETISNCDIVSDQVALGADQVSAGAQTLSQGTTEQAASVEELSATINQVTNRIKTTADSAQYAKSVTNDTRVAIEESQSQMDEMVTAMKNISDTSNEISNIIKNIDDIAFQTNILALNAAVEAARAGEAGKGFAVVADEVRNLASKSAESAKNTSALIENAINAINDGTNIVLDTAKSLTTVVENSQKTDLAILEIAKSSEQEAESMYQINVGIEQISSVVQNNSATSEESAAASEELSGQASQLKELLDKFKI